MILWVMYEDYDNGGPGYPCRIYMSWYCDKVKDIIQKCLDNPKIYSKLYFGSGVEKSKKSEFWHGEIWKESPFFGKHMLKINRSMSYPLICIWCWKRELACACMC